MIRHLSLLVSALLLCASVAVVVWVRWPIEQHRVDDWDLSASEVPIDPAIAVATIHELRAQFGSVLSGTELEMADSGTYGVDEFDGPSSFDDFLREAAGLPSPSLDEVDVAPSGLAAESPLLAGQLAPSLRKTAGLLDEQSQQAAEMGPFAQQQRFSGLATLLRAEADLLESVRQAERNSGDAPIAR